MSKTVAASTTLYEDAKLAVLVFEMQFDVSEHREICKTLKDVFTDMTSAINEHGQDAVAEIILELMKNVGHFLRTHETPKESDKCKQHSEIETGG